MYELVFRLSWSRRRERSVRGEQRSNPGHGASVNQARRNHTQLLIADSLPTEGDSSKRTARRSSSCAYSRVTNIPIPVGRDLYKEIKTPSVKRTGGQIDIDGVQYERKALREALLRN